VAEQEKKSKKQNKMKDLGSNPRSNTMQLLAERQSRMTSVFIPTRHSLLSRLKNWDDQESWRVFFETYWRLIYGTALKAGLSDAESQDVVQETVISVMKSMPGFKYDSARGSFKGWLLRLTQWRIIDQLRKRQARIEPPVECTDDNDDTNLIDNLMDPVTADSQAAWDEEWERNLVEAAIEKVKAKVDPKQYQIFDLYVVKCWPVLRLSRILGVNPATVYLTKHRISKLINEEVNRLRTKPI